jgi:hypothetical protein
VRQFGKTRRQLFEDIDIPNLKPLPVEPWVHAEWKRCRVGLDYHVACQRHHYSVPCRYARREVEVRITARTVEVFLGSERIAVHMRGSGMGGIQRSLSICPPAIGAMATGRLPDPRERSGSGQ